MYNIRIPFGRRVEVADIGAEVRKVRGERTQEAFARDIGCTLQTIVRWESGQRTPTHHLHVVALHREGVSMTDLVAALSGPVAA